jgi:rubrerythrin
LPDFATARETISFDKKLSKKELIRAIRFSIAAEYEAVQIYEQIVEAIDDPKVKAVITDIVNEERVHAGQFLNILFDLDPSESKYYDEGAQENAEIKQKTSK